ncbi:hypothetical protein [Embleya sp. AB8]|uniref:hypothetical protein n=1 Tax=Embleya sp. AB8 TaxID=3156304 RepID=UPI003C795149
MSRYTVEYTDLVRAELRAMSTKTRVAFEEGVGVIARDPYGADSRPYPGGGNDDHRITQIAGVAVITYMITKTALLVTVVKLVARP